MCELSPLSWTPEEFPMTSETVVTSQGGGTGGQGGEATINCSILFQNLPDSSGFVCAGLIL